MRLDPSHDAWSAWPQHMCMPVQQTVWHAVQIAPMLSGRIDIQYRRVQCTPPSNLVVDIDQNSGTGGFLKMSVTVSPAESVLKP